MNKMLIGMGSVYLLVVDQSYTRNDFVESFKAESGTWAEGFANRLYDCLFGNSTNLLEEHTLFYRQEYPEFTTFLERVYGLSDDTIREVEGKMDANSVIFYGSYGSEGDSNTSQLIEFSDEIVESINEVLGQGIKDEN